MSGQPSGKGQIQVTDAQGKPNIPLKHLFYTTAVNGAFARVRCRQEFENESPHPVEAVYIFPMPDEASVTSCVMQIGQRRVQAVIKKRQEARQEYEEAVAIGHHGALLEQERPNIFTMNVGGIEAGEKIEVIVDYVQRVPFQAGGGRFRLPLVVAPQFIPGKPTGEQAGGFSPDTDEVPDASRITPLVAPEGVPYDAEISLSFAPGFRTKVSSPSHPTLVTEQTVAKAETVEIKTGSIVTDRDFILVYKSVSKVPEVAVHIGEFQGESFALVSIFPPGEVEAQPLDCIFVLDCSGSMDGAKISGLRIVAKNVLGQLRGQNLGHQVGVLPFDDRPRLAHPLGEINESTERFIVKQEANNGTRLGFALEEAERMLSESSSGRSKAILLVTDGDTEHGKDWQSRDGTRLIAVGIDTAVNDVRINELARRNHGVAEFVLPGENYDAVANRLAGYLSGPVLQNVQVETQGDVTGGRDVFQGRPATVAVRFSGKTKDLRITGKDLGDQDCHWDIKLEGAVECDFLPQIWAREFIRETADSDKQVEASLKYGVICSQTSFVAISEKEIPGQKPKRVEIPVNLPHGWNYDAVFGRPSFGTGFGIRRLVGGSGSSFRRCALSPRYEDAGGSALGLVEEVEEFESVDLDDSSASSTSSRFNLTTPDLLDRLIAILIEVEEGNRQTAEDSLVTATPKEVVNWSEEKRAAFHYFMLRLLSHGLRLTLLKAEVKDFLRNASQTPEAAVWHNLARREEGVFQKDQPAIPPGMDGADYILWKLGKGLKPASEPWSLVP